MVIVFDVVGTLFSLQKIHGALLEEKYRRWFSRGGLPGFFMPPWLRH
jgi:hypothetical protein